MELFRCKGSSGGQLLHPSAQSKVSTESRMGFSGLFFGQNLKTSKDREPEPPLRVQKLLLRVLAPWFSRGWKWGWPTYSSL